MTPLETIEKRIAELEALEKVYSAKDSVGWGEYEYETAKPEVIKLLRALLEVAKESQSIMDDHRNGFWTISKMNSLDNALQALDEIAAQLEVKP